jgi:PAS domain S-box-containing protein
VLFLLVAFAIAAAGALSYVAGASDLRLQKEQELAGIAALKVDEIERWRAERLADADAIAAHPTLMMAIGSASRGDAGGVEPVLAPWFDSLREIGECSAIALVSAGGEVRFAAGEEGVDAENDEIRRLVRRALRERRPLLSDAHRHGPRDTVHLSIAAPVSGGSDTRWVVLVRVDPYRSLYRMIQSWPTPSPTAETLLVHRSGDRISFANELRHRHDDPNALHLSLARSDDPAIRAAMGDRGVIEGVDYRGHRVLAAIQRVPGSPWTLVAKVDVAEAFAPLASLRLWIGVVVFALLLAAGAGAALWWRVQAAAFERSRLRDREERRSLAHKLEHLTKYALDMIFIADEDVRIVEANDRALTTLGFSREELIGMPVRELRDPATASDFDVRVSEGIERGATIFETRYRRRDGTTLPVEVSVHCDEYEGRRYFHAIARDISARKQAEEALRASEAKFRAAFEFASLGIVLVSPDGRIVETNRAFRTMLGYGDEDMRGVPCLRLHEPAEGPTPTDVLDGMRDGRIERLEQPRRFVRRDGSIAETITRSSALRDESGAFRFSLCVVEDVSARKRLEAQLLLADRMASIGTLAAGVAHEINNPLAFILANVDFAIGELRGAGVDPEVVQALVDAKDGGQRVREIVRDLKSFSRATDDERELVDVRHVLHSAIGLASNEIRHRAQLVVEEGDVAPILANEYRVSQVVLNLLINAAQAIPEGHASENVVRAATFTASDGRAVVEISDTGAGIPPEILPRIFDPFFTTKPVGVGTGLGLSICHGIVTALGGDIEVESAPGRGSTFRVRLPPGARSEEARHTPAPLPPPVRRSRILVVDDEALVVRAVARILSPQHDVVARTSARVALEEIASGSNGFDLVLCDLMMPDMTGMELHARLDDVAPELARRVVFLTGGAFTSDARAFLERVPNARIEKPFEPRALRDAVARALGSATTARAAPA